MARDLANNNRSNPEHRMHDLQALEAEPVGLDRFQAVRAHTESLTAALTPEMAMDLLEGDAGTTVELVIYSPSVGTRMVLLQRRPIPQPAFDLPACVTCPPLKSDPFLEGTASERRTSPRRSRV